jgi:hypothetical protein
MVVITTIYYIKFCVKRAILGGISLLSDFMIAEIRFYDSEKKMYGKKKCMEMVPLSRK